MRTASSPEAGIVLVIVARRSPHAIIAHADASLTVHVGTITHIEHTVAIALKGQRTTTHTTVIIHTGVIGQSQVILNTNGTCVHDRERSAVGLREIG